MWNPIKTTLISIVAMLLSAHAVAYTNGDYPRLAETIVDGKMLSAGNSKLTNAIEKGNAIPLIFDSQFNSLTSTLFPAPYFDSYMAQKLNGEGFVAGLRHLVEQFACSEYRFRHGLKQSDRCNGYTTESADREPMPFVGGIYVDRRMEYHLDDKQSGISYYFYLENSAAVGLDKLLGSVHQLGSFFGRQFDRRQLQLAIRVMAYQLDNNGNRSSAPVYNKPLSYLVILPTSQQIYKQANQTQAARFAAGQARLLILKS
ncbi:hypothetical protein [Vibrio sp. SCSIO 43137]|uniref:hypothetical protein n=1 Tax=Vibrio sp. SCSIO 43137 TaxID=3021011 RepID=UPI002307F007|nr:hypothetical protein [Vibrio sp. SCSIO 43137]WCE32275.1 hypothetical protein PK654_17415 [Vibrio sp. SCSIO 43137]